MKRMSASKNFENLTKRLLAVPRSEIKAKLEEEKQEKIKRKSERKRLEKQ